MIDHTGIGVSDVARLAAFYDAALAALGLRRVAQIPSDTGADAVGYGITYPMFWIDRFHPHSVRNHTAFVAVSRAAVDAFHAAALAAGGTDHGAPGLRDPATGYPPGYYAAFVLDPDGNKPRSRVPRRMILAVAVHTMHGEHRMPTLLTAVDHACRGLA